MAHEVLYLTYFNQYQAYNTMYFTMIVPVCTPSKNPKQSNVCFIKTWSIFFAPHCYGGWYKSGTISMYQYHTNP